MKTLPIKRYIAFTCVVTMIFFAECKEEYNPQIEGQNSGFLVVEGFISSGPGPTTIRLSRSSDLKDTVLKPQINAFLNVEGEDGSNFPLFNNGNGEYTVGLLTLSGGVRYRLHIRTTDGKEYASDYNSVKYTPPIDSITWQRENDGVRIYANAHDAQNAAKYYQWKYEETWEIHSTYYSKLMYVNDANGIPIEVV